MDISRYRIVFLSNVLLIALIIVPMTGSSQALLSSKQEIEGVSIYSDAKNSNEYYYAPGKLGLFEDQAGKPEFKLIQMRYTGSGVTGNQGEKRFMNIVQFRIVMEQHKTSVLNKVRKALAPKAELRPLPMSQVEAVLVAPFQGTYKSIGKGVFDNETKGKGKGSFWRERVFTVRLENYEAQLLWDMVEKEQLAISLAYTYYGELINDITIDILATADSLAASMEKLKEEIETRDTTVSTTLIHSDAFSLDVDISKYPEVLVKKDLNNGMPPAYPALQIACYDFYNDLRNDLLMKDYRIPSKWLE